MASFVPGTLVKTLETNIMDMTSKLDNLMTTMESMVRPQRQQHRKERQAFWL